MQFVSLEPLWWLLVPALLVGVFVVSLVRRPLGLRVGAFVLRLAGMALLILALAQPFATRRSDDAHVVFLLDVSESVDLEAAAAALDRIEAQLDSLRPGDTASLLAVGAGVLSMPPQELRERFDEWRSGLSDDVFRSESRLSDALLEARMEFQAGRGRRIVLYSDGQDTTDGLAEAVATLRREGIDLRLVELPGIEQAEAAIVSIQPSTRTAHVGQKVGLRIRLSSNRAMPATLRLVHRGVVHEEVPVDLLPGEANVVRAEVTMSAAGANIWTAELLCDDDHFAINNAASCTVQVHGRARVLALHRDPSRLRPLERALRAQEIDLEVRGEHGLPTTLEGLLEFDAIVLADVLARRLSTRQMLYLRQYVTHFGGGLVMLGSENSFGLGGYHRTPVEEVMPLISRYEREQERPSVAMVLVIDKSGSMSGMPIELARQAAKSAVELLGTRDFAGVVAFDSEAVIVCDMTTASDVSLQTGIDSIVAGGGTNMYPGMDIARQMLEGAQARIKHMIVLGDGMSMPGPFLELAGDLAAAGITVSTVALGPGADRPLMSAIADAGGGRYYETLDPTEVPQIFAAETMEVGRSAIREEPFTPVAIGQSDLLDGIDFSTAPFLLGYVMTRARPAATVQLLTESGDPLLAVGRFGLGTGVAFTSDASDRWAGEWLRWRGFGRLWAQILRACVRSGESSGIDVATLSEGQELRYVIRRRDVAGRAVNEAQWQAVAISEAGGLTHPTVTQIGWGLYECRVPRPAHGDLTLRLRDGTDGTMRVVHHREDYPREYRLWQEPPAELAAIPRLAPDEPVWAGVPAVESRRSLQHLALLAGVACLLGGILLRRI